MAYVSVPKDLTKVKNKVAFNLTKRQLICIGIGAAMGIPSYFLLRNVMGNSNAATVMVLLMLPAFLFAMYEKDGMHPEDVLMHMIRVKFLRPPVRKYETENYYDTIYNADSITKELDLYLLKSDNHWTLLQNSELLDVFSGGLSSVYSNSEEEAYKKLLDLLEENN